MNNNLFNNAEDEFLKKFPMVKEDILKELMVSKDTPVINDNSSDDMSNSNSIGPKQLVKVRTINSNSAVRPVESPVEYQSLNNNYSTNTSYGDFSSDQRGNSFVIVLCAIIAFVAIVYLVSTFVFINM